VETRFYSNANRVRQRIPGEVTKDSAEEDGCNQISASASRDIVFCQAKCQNQSRLKKSEADMQLFRRCATVMIFTLAFGSAVAEPTDQAAVSNLLHSTFDRPEAALRVAPVVVAGNHAIAGWTQGDMGGRALLRRKQQTWELILCAGDGIKSRDALAKAGIPNSVAATLERELAAAEGKLDPGQVAMFSRFEGVLMMDGSGNHPPSHHPPHSNH
jgi:hypothetical protein